MAEGASRWRYFRLGSLSHNVVTIDGRNQRAGCRVPITAFYADARRAHARFDLTAAYAGQVSAASRGFALLDAHTVLVQDELTGGENDVHARWAMLTSATVELDGATAILRLNGRALRVRALAPVGARWQVESAEPPTAVETPNPGKILLTLHLGLPAKSTARIVVIFEPAEAEAWPVESVPLAAWSSEAALPLERAK
ncbi:MAG: heparinase II/III family protein [Opitutaceae bacterium]|nr:heparinase II/III family protein [Opitutaceae bacterium]